MFFQYINIINYFNYLYRFQSFIVSRNLLLHEIHHKRAVKGHVMGIGESVKTYSPELKTFLVRSRNSSVYRVMEPGMIIIALNAMEINHGCVHVLVAGKVFQVDQFNACFCQHG